jgi:hypothetical protein
MHLRALLGNGATLSVLFGLAFWTCALFIRGCIREMSASHSGACATCGYDLSSTASGVPCPECGNRCGIQRQGDLLKDETRLKPAGSIDE